jgi:tight adherence protein B
MLTALWCLAATAALAVRGRPRPTAPGGPTLERVAGRLADLVLGWLRGPPPADDIGGLCTAICAELRAGAPPDRALLEASRHSRLIPRSRAAAMLGEPIADALAADAAAAVNASDGASPALAGMAACWSAAADSGAGLAEGLERVATLAWAHRRVRADLEAETAAPKATARTLALLPVIGLVLGQVLGASPVSWLLGDPIGRACLAGGALLQVAGRLWAGRILQQALPRDRAPMGYGR